MVSIVQGSDGKVRCGWCSAAPEFIAYHDQEWGYPVADDQRLFEKLCLESFQSGLSWRTIYAKRDNFRAAFAGFDFNTVADYTSHDVERLLADSGIVRHRGKIEAVINNACRARELVAQEGSLARYFWSYESVTEVGLEAQSRSYSSQSKALAKDLKKRGWKFVGPTTVYAFMQAMGLINDHTPECWMHGVIDHARSSFTRP